MRVRSKQLETEDPLVVQLEEDSGEDIEHVEMLNALEKDTTNLPENSELKQLASYRDRLSVVILSGRARLIVRDELEILILKPLRPKVLDIQHFTHSGDETMWKQTKNKIFWTKMYYQNLVSTIFPMSGYLFGIPIWIFHQYLISMQLFATLESMF